MYSKAKMDKENESASKTSGDSKSSGASTIETDSSRKKLKELLKRDEGIPSEMKRLCKEVLKQLKEAELQIKILEHKAVASQKDYQRLFDTSMEKSAEIQREKNKRVNFQTLYHAMRTPEVVRTEIIKFEEHRRDKFNSKDLNTEGLEEHTISNEVRAERWKFMLKNLDDSQVRWLKRSIIFQKLFKNKQKYFTKDDRAAFKNIEKATGHKRHELNNAVEKHLIAKWFEDDFIKSLFKYLNEGSCTNNSCQTWCNLVLDDFADLISKVFSVISEIHTCAFDEEDEGLPDEYRILKRPEYDETIIVLMSHYTSGNSMDG